MLDPAVAIQNLSELPEKQATAYVKGRPSTRTLYQVGGVWLEADTARAAQAMVEDAKRDEVSLDFNSGFRSMAEQRALWDAYQAGTGKLAGRPGYSNHQGGIAIDIDTDGQAEADVGRGRMTTPYRWLHENAADFGFVRTVPSEPWHWEYHGGWSPARKTGTTIVIMAGMALGIAWAMARRR